MAKTDQLGQPNANDIQQGKYSLVRIVRCSAGAAAPVVWTNIYGVQSLTLNPVEWGFTKEIFQQGGGDESLKLERQPMWSGQITFLKNRGLNELADFTGITWTTAGTVAHLHYNNDDYPDVIMEVVARDEDNSTHLFSVVIPDMILDGFGFDNPLDDSEFVLPFHTRRPPMTICAGTEAVYDVFTGDGSTLAFTTSGTALALGTASTEKYLDYDKLAYVKEQDTSASTGTLKKTGYSLSGTTLTATTAPAASTKVQVLYVKAS